MNEESMPVSTIRKTVLRMVLVVGGMFCFGFALVPLYDVFCRVTGLNGKTSGEAYQPVDVKIDTSRTVRVQFVATNNDGMSWKFGPRDTELVVHPGEPKSTMYFAMNPEQRQMVAQAIPSISPARAAEYFHKTECFCFNQQTLEPGQQIDMPMRFIVDQDLPKDVHTITLTYTLFDVTQRVAANN
jgi:cytochrome c oxidase assembly protein subunit 11